MNIDTAIDQGDRDSQQDAIAVLPLLDGSVAAAVCDGLGAHNHSEHAANAAAWAWATTAALLAPGWSGDSARRSHLDRMAAAADDAARLGNAGTIAPHDPRTAIAAVLVCPDEGRQTVWGWAVGDVLAVHVGPAGEVLAVSRPHRHGRHALSRCLPRRASEMDRPVARPAPEVDLIEPQILGTLYPGEMLILATDGAWECAPNKSVDFVGHDHIDGAEFLAGVARVAFGPPEGRSPPRSLPRPAAEILAASKARWPGGSENSRDNAAICVIWRNPAPKIEESDDDRPF